MFDFLRQTEPTNCLHMDQNFLFLFDLISTMKFIEQLRQTNSNILIETLRQQVEASHDPQFWNNPYVCHSSCLGNKNTLSLLQDYYKPSPSAAPTLSTQSSNQKDSERYNELLAHRYLYRMNS